MSLLQPVPLIVKAIEEVRMIRLMYHGKQRILEPHDHGILNGSVQLLGWQTAGSSSRPIPNWLLMKTDEISDLILLDEIFPGGRPTHKGEHIQWDVLFIRVRPAADLLRAAGDKALYQLITGRLTQSCRKLIVGLGRFSLAEFSTAAGAVEMWKSSLVSPHDPSAHARRLC